MESTEKEDEKITTILGKPMTRKEAALMITKRLMKSLKEDENLTIEELKLKYGVFFENIWD